MANISTRWNSNVPSDASKVGLGAGNIRTNKRCIYDALRHGTSFPDAHEAGLYPVISQGAPRPIVAVQSASSYSAVGAPMLEGKLFFASDTSRLFVYNSTSNGVSLSPSTQLVGSPQYIEHLTDGGTGTWVESSGFTAISSASGVYAVSYGNIVYAGMPVVTATSDDTSLLMRMTSVTSTNFTVRLRPYDDSAAANITLYWSSSGTTSGRI